MKKLSQMTSDERVEHWVHQHTRNVVSGIGEKRAVASANRLISKLLFEIYWQRGEAVREYRHRFGTPD